MNRILLSLVLSTSLFSADWQLKKTDVRKTFDEMTAIHVEHGNLNQLVFSRALKIFINQFDLSKIYFLGSELEEIAHLSNKQLEEGIHRFKTDDLSLFVQLNLLVQKAITRAQEWRAEIWKELILSMQDMEISRGETYLSFAENEQQLKKRVAKQLTRLLLEDKEQLDENKWTPAIREKIANLWERRFKEREENYLTKNTQHDHFLTLHCLHALAKSLDAHSAYFSPEEAHEIRMSLEKQFEGIGVVLKETIDGIVIHDLVKGGPAEKSGKIKVGDQILKIDGKAIAGMKYTQVLESLKTSGDVHLALRSKADKKNYDVSLKREKILMNDDRLRYQSHPYADGNIGVLTLPSFYEGDSQSNAEKDMREALKALKKQGPLKGVILDMRENAGGFLSQAVKVASLFITKGVIVISKYSKGEIKYLRNLDGRLYFDGPLIVLTSKASASAAEIVAQALQDYGAALIVGDESTYGKGTIQYQTITDKEAKAFYKVTVGRYYTVSGRSTQIVGVKSDIVVPSIYSFYKIGEKFLDFPLSNDQVASAYVDPLTDIDHMSRSWFQKNYLPNLHKAEDRWQKIAPQLAENSKTRLAKDPNFTTFIKTMEKKKEHAGRLFEKISNPPWGQEDIQMGEALNIMKDMIELDNI